MKPKKHKASKQSCFHEQKEPIRVQAGVRRPRARALNPIQKIGESCKIGAHCPEGRRHHWKLFRMYIRHKYL
jgi:hypothetical protein